MKHFGDITKIHGADVPPVNVIIGGSPCQDLSIAGKRKGLDGERSGLFMEQIRIIKEMRAADENRGRRDEHIRPRFMVWENVPGAFSSNKGADFGAVLKETIKVVCEEAPDIPMPKGGWTKSGCLTDVGRRWSVAWRVFDAQFWGVPQRRRRIALVADFGGASAPEILFEREGVQGNPSESECEWQGTATDTPDGIRGNGRTISLLNDQGGSVIQASDNADVSPTLRAEMHGNIPAVAFSIENHPNDSRVKLSKDNVVQTLSSRMGTGGGNTPMVMECFGKEVNDEW